VFLRKSGEKRLGKDRERFELVAADGKSEEREIDGGGTEAFEEDGSDFFDDGDFGFGKFTRELCQMRG
jgi:hypothetical protein